MGWQSALDEWLEKPHELGHLLGFSKLSEVHSDWVKLFLNAPISGQVVLQAHRNSYKTTSGLVAMTLLYMLYPDIRILIVRKSLTNGEKLVIAMQNIFNSDIVRAWMYDRHNITTLETEVWSRSQIVLKCKKKITVEPSLQAVGIGNSVTGAHFDYIWSDDIVTIEDRYSAAERENTKNYVYELANIIEPLGSRVYTGTTWHEDDAFSILPPAKKYPIGSVSIIGIDEAWITEKRTNMPNSLWCANYELTHVFDGAIIGAFEVIPRFTSDYLVAWFDTSFSDKGKSDETALSIVGFAIDTNAPTNYWPIEFTGMLWKKSISNPEVIKDALIFLNRFKPLEAILESQLAESTHLFIAAFKETEKELGLEVKNHWDYEHQRGGPKHERIMMYVDGNKARIKVIEGTDPIYLKSIMHYAKGTKDHDDGPDSLAGAIYRWQTSPNLRNYVYNVEQLRNVRT